MIIEWSNFGQTTFGAPSGKTHMVNHRDIPLNKGLALTASISPALLAQGPVPRLEVQGHLAHRNLHTVLFPIHLKVPKALAFLSVPPAQRPSLAGLGQPGAESSSLGCFYSLPLLPRAKLGYACWVSSHRKAMHTR